ncbi:hypothetical protein R1flu_005747 [Riccia fluitans]|uniref:RING-type E3 ubiquitin transferase n=1 Tax=Riccia fluitans TaxID=41844 RepID=A0ABD1YUR4_9MARC
MERYNSGRDGYNGIEAAAPQQWHSSYNNNSTNSRSSGSIREETEEMGSVSGLDSWTVRNMVTVMGGYAMNALLDADGRSSMKEKCAERLKQEHGVIASYAEQAVLANLDWGIQGLEKAVKATNPDIKLARLEHTEEVLQVAVNLDPQAKTGGVANSYLSSWANYYMALVWKLRNNDRNAALSFLEMFIVEPNQARKDFAPALWDQLFRPHMANIEAWYQAELAQIMSSSPPLGTNGRLDIPQKRRNRSGDLDGSHSRTLSKSTEQEFDDGSSIAGDSNNGDMTPRRQGRGKEPTLAADQVMRLELLNKLYQDSLDENTQQYAQYYKDWMAYEAENLMQGSVQGSPVSSIMRSPLSYSSQETDQQQQTPRQDTSNGASGFGPGGAGSNQNKGRIYRHPSLDRESDTFSEASYKDPLAFSRNSSINQSIQEVDEESYKERGAEHSRRRPQSGSNTRQDFDDGAVLSGDEDDCSSTSEFGKGAGVFLDGEEITEEELLQVWEELSEGRVTSADADEFISRLTDQDDKPVTYERLSELAETARTSSRENRSPPEQLQIVSTLEAAVSATNFEAVLVPVPSSRRNFSPSPISSIEDEEPGSLSRQGSVIAQSPFSEAFRRMQSDSSHSSLSSHSSRSLSIKHETLSREQSMIKPPKDYVCPITNQLFQDPVTLETGQTYERTAIKEWLDRGNKTCPNTRNMLRNLELPQTNYVLKRLVDTWKEDHPQYFQDSSRASPAKESSVDGPLSAVLYSNGVEAVSDELERQPSGRRGGRRIVPLPEDQVIPNLEETLIELRGAVDTLFKTDDLVQCEKAVRVAALAWVESKGDASVASSFSKSGVVEKLMEVFKNSKKDDVLRSVVFLLSDLISKDESTRETVLHIDPTLEATVTVLKSPGVPQSAVLLHLLKAPSFKLAGLKLVPSLVAVLKTAPTYEEETFLMPLSPKCAAVCLLEQMVTTLDHRVNMKNAEAIVAADGVRHLMERLEAKTLEEKISAVAVMWSCLQSDGGIRTTMAENLKIKTLVDLLNNSNEQARTVAIFFLAELIRLNRRPAVQKILEEVLRQGQLNSMHVLMAHLKVSPFEHRSLVASLLLQMDLLAEPREPSMFREEALEALVNALSCEENNKVQLEAAKALASLSGRFSITGRSMTEAYLLKFAGVNVEDHSRSRGNVLSAEEEMAADEWDKRMAIAVLGNGKSLIDAVGTVLPSKSSKIARLCLVTAAWITCALRNMPESGLQVCARNCFLPSLVAILQPGRDMEEKVLACLCLFNLTDDSVGLQQLTIFAKDLFAQLRRMKRVTWTAKKIVTALIASPYMNNDLWAHGRVSHLDASGSGETRCLLYFRGHLYSGHTDHSIKVWGVKRKNPRLICETKEHSRAVLCFAVIEESQKLFSGSADKTVRVWTLSEERLKCLQVIDIREAVHAIAANSSTIVVIPQNAGVKVLDANGTNPRVLNGNKHVQSINLTENHLYCGCTDSSIQEIDPGTGTSVSLQSGVSSLRGKKAIYSLQSSAGLLYSAGTLVEGIGTKMWSLATRAMIHFISTTMDVRCMAISDDLIYLSNNQPTGNVEVWLRDKYQKVAMFTVGSKILSMAVVGDTVYTASVDGILRAWSLT